MKLTILIPVYNGARYLDVLLSHLSACGDLEHVEILVANNKSTDDTVAIARSYPVVRVIDFPDHVPTAEQNLFRSFKHCRGEYVWTLGVDDIPICNSIPPLLQLLERGYDFMVFNNAMITEDGAPAANGTLRLSASAYEIPIAKLAERIGLWFTLAGISGHVLRKSCVEAYDLDGLIRKTSTIYSHVIAYMECFAAKRTALVNLPLVYYRLTYRDTAHWKRAAERLNVCDEYFWTIGFLRQIKYLENAGVIAPTFLQRLVDHNDHLFYRPVRLVAEKLFNQLRLMSTRDSRNTLSAEDFGFVMDFLLTRDPLARELVWILRDIWNAGSRGNAIPKHVWKKAEAALAAYIQAPLLHGMLEKTLDDYEIYRVTDTYYAVRDSCHGVLQEWLRYIEGVDISPILFCGASLKEVEAKILSAPRTMPEYIRLKEIHSADDATELRRRLTVMTNSRSWKITKPLRNVAKMLHLSRPPA